MTWAGVGTTAVFLVMLGGDDGGRNSRRTALSPHAAAPTRRPRPPYQRGGLSEVWDCLEKQYPRFLGMMLYSNGRWVDRNIDYIGTPWPALTEPTLSAVSSRFSR